MDPFYPQVPVPRLRWVISASRPFCPQERCPPAAARAGPQERRVPRDSGGGAEASSAHMCLLPRFQERWWPGQVTRAGSPLEEVQVPARGRARRAWETRGATGARGPGWTEHWVTAAGRRDTTGSGCWPATVGFIWGATRGRGVLHRMRLQTRLQVLPCRKARDSCAPGTGGIRPGTGERASPAAGVPERDPRGTNSGHEGPPCPRGGAQGGGVRVGGGVAGSTRDLRTGARGLTWRALGGRRGCSMLAAGGCRRLPAGPAPPPSTAPLHPGLEPPPSADGSTGLGPRLEPLCAFAPRARPEAGGCLGPSAPPARWRPAQRPPEPLGHPPPSLQISVGLPGWRA